jgi:hypothetical protein
MGMEQVKLLQNKHKKCMNLLEKQYVKHLGRISQKMFLSFMGKCKPENAKEISLNQM